MPYIIDGNNLIGSSPDISLEDPNSRQKIVDIIRKFQENKKTSVIVVFDGEPDYYSHHQVLTNKLTIIYPRFGGTADDEIKKILNRYTYFRDVVLVSSDRELKDFAKNKGAKTINSTEFHFELKRSYRAQGKKENTDKRINTRLSKNEVDQWLKVFED
ncbi:MAG: NYN domain-containing protein [Candidatus Aminicenantes bacterium]|nr:NYN domain-containing protein [Candidatus Aminicenantes bacterium]